MYKAIAMWSGPRNISTAMMYAFASRADCTAWDEPFYAWYLCETKLDHPLGQAVIEAGETNAKKVIEQCCATGDRFVYQKHMSQHMLENLDRSWIGQLNNAFLIREPDQVLASYAKKRAEVTLAEIGYLQQLEIFKLVADQSGAMPPVVDSRKFLRSPETGLRELCAGWGLPLIQLCFRGPPTKALRWRLGAALVQRRLAIDRLCQAPRGEKNCAAGGFAKNC